MAQALTAHVPDRNQTVFGGTVKFEHSVDSLLNTTPSVVLQEDFSINTTFGVLFILVNNLNHLRENTPNKERRLYLWENK